MKYVYRAVSESDVFTEAGDLKPRSPGSKARPRPATKPSIPTAVAVLVEASKYSGAALRRIRAERGVGRPPEAMRQRLARLAARASSF